MEKAKSVQEKRENVRVRVQSLIKYAIEPNVTTFQAANIQNVSRGGLVFFAEQEIRAGAVLWFCFLPPNRKKPVEARGKSVWCSQVQKNKKVFKIGVQFLEVSEDAKLAIQELEAFYLERQKKIRPSNFSAVPSQRSGCSF